ncbi:MAG: hypothetical protein ACRYFU_18075 [Janthinobacterium lividum]
MFTQADLLEALRDCFVPALRRDVVTAGLVRSATLELDADAPGAGIRGVPTRFIARIMLTAPGVEEAVNAQTRAAVENRLLGLEAISRVEITLRPPLFSILS